MVTEAYERYRGTLWRGRRLHPGARERVARPVRHLRRRRPRSVVRDRRRRDAGSRSRASPSRSCSPWSATTVGYEAARHRLGVNSTGFPFNSLMAVELNDDRTMNPLVNAGAIATTSLIPGHGRGEVGRTSAPAVPVRRPRAEMSEEVYASESATNMRNQGIAHLLDELRPAVLRPRRGHRRLHPPVLPRRDRRRTSR